MVTGVETLVESCKNDVQGSTKGFNTGVPFHLLKYCVSHIVKHIFTCEQKHNTSVLHKNFEDTSYKSSKEILRYFLIY